MAALSRLSERAEAYSASEPEHFIFPACENDKVDPTPYQRSWRTAWRSLVAEAAKRAGVEAAEQATQVGRDPEEARHKASQPFCGFRFHDLRISPLRN
jgi:hypothetical protein